MSGIPSPRLETERLVLRRWSQDDHAPFARICADPMVMRFIGSGNTRTPEEAARSVRSFEAHWQEHGFGLFAVEHKVSGELIGFAGLAIPTFLPEILPAVEIGWRFDRAMWGKGYATEAARAALKFGTDAIGLSGIVSIYQIGNDASVKIMQRLGMEFDRATLDPKSKRAIEVYRLPDSTKAQNPNRD